MDISGLERSSELRKSANLCLWAHIGPLRVYHKPQKIPVFERVQFTEAQKKHQISDAASADRYGTRLDALVCDAGQHYRIVLNRSRFLKQVGVLRNNIE